MPGINQECVLLPMWLLNDGYLWPQLPGCYISVEGGEELLHNMTMLSELSDPLHFATSFVFTLGYSYWHPGLSNAYITMGERNMPRKRMIFPDSLSLQNGLTDLQERVSL